MSEHTPGPWRGDGQAVVAGALAPNTVAIVSIPLRHNLRAHEPVDGEVAANVNLIAAAPDLLAALERLRPMVCQCLPVGRALDDQSVGFICGVCVEIFEPVIAKARGGK